MLSSPCCLQFFKEVYGGTFLSEEVKSLPLQNIIFCFIPHYMYVLCMPVVVLVHFQQQVRLHKPRYFLSSFYATLCLQEAVRDALTIANVDNPIWAIVVVNHLDFFNGKIEYKIRMNFTTTPPTTDTIHRRRKGVLTYYKQYYTSGFLSLQVQFITFLCYQISSLLGGHWPPPSITSSHFVV